ncbi:PilX N-terminal domain-containing pilus assembly protein [Granulosicoccus sp. 3-233]|uniref:PilX N-terminal domain-containing pilus assembly protein n=1 Tax=Granulosicoccus sp. 3-233 TaxID=3417969 RepID=UPI003D32A4D4
MKNRKRQICKPLKQEKGVALVVSLVLLIAMTILGVATLSGTRLNEKRTSNAQQKAIAFEVAESAIASVWDVGYLNVALTSDATDSGDDPAAIVSPDEDTELTNAFDQLTDGKGVNIDGELSVQYCGETAPVASDLSADLSATQLVFLLVDVNSQVQVANTSTRSDHVQRGAVTSVKTNRTGNCPAP